MDRPGPSGWRSGDTIVGDVAKVASWRVRSAIGPYARRVAEALMRLVPLTWLMRARAGYADRVQRAQDGG